MGKGPLCNMVDYVHISDVDLCLKDVWENGFWNLNRLATPISDQVRTLLLNNNVPNIISPDHPDCWVWKDSNDGIFKASSGY